MKFLALLSLSILLYSCSSSESHNKTQDTTNETKTQEANKVTPLKNCLCVKMYMPVCGKDQKTYGNACEAECRGIEFTQGSCEDQADLKKL